MQLILSDDELKRLEARCGSKVRYIGSWNSDGVFAYVSVPLTAVKKAAELLGNSSLVEAVSQLTRNPDPNRHFAGILETFGPALVEKIAAVCREHTDLFIESADRENGQVVEWAWY